MAIVSLFHNGLGSLCCRESGAKSHGGVSIDPVTIVPIKIEYGARVSDEFMYAAEEERINILKAFNDGLRRRLLRS